MAADNTEGIGILIRPWVRKFVNSVALNGVPIKYPIINTTTKNWMLFDPVSNAYIDSGVIAEGRTPEIGANGNWWIAEADTGKSALARNIELDADSAHIKWRYTGDTVWTNIVTLDELKGEDGERLALRMSGTKLQYQYASDGAMWTDLFDLATIGGGGATRYIHIQTSPNNTWNCQHNLGVAGVSATVINSDGEEVVGFINRQTSTANLLVIEFGASISGEAYIRP